MLSFYLKWKTIQLFRKKQQPNKLKKAGPTAKCNQENCKLFSYS